MLTKLKKFISLKEWTVSLQCLFAPCPFFACAPTSLSGLTSPVDHLLYIDLNSLEVFSGILVFGSGQLAF